MQTNQVMYKRVALWVAAWFIFFVAILLNKNQALFLMAAILGLMQPVSWLLGRIMLAGLACERVAPTSCEEGERILVTLTITNVGWLPKFFLRAGDRLPRWLRYAGDSSPVILSLQPGESSQVSYYLEPEKRGAYILGPAYVFSTDPLGFYVFTRILPVQSELLVFPTPLPLSRSPLTESAGQGWQAQEGALARGGGIDFHGVREYQPGDELRRVHWRTTARVGKLVVAEYSQGASMDAIVALDLNQAAYANTGQGPESALEYAVKLATTLCDDLLRGGSAVQLITPGTVETAGPPSSDITQRPRFLETLARAEPDSTLTLPEALRRYRARVGAQTSLIYITPHVGDPELAASVAPYEATGARVFGLALDGPSFRVAQMGAKQGVERLGAERLAAQPPGSGAGIVQWVHQGDALAQILESMSYARK